MNKKKTTLTVDQALLEEAKNLPLPPLSHLFEATLREAIKTAKIKQWHENSEAAIAKYNQRIEKEGTLGEQLGVWSDETI